MRKYGAIGDFQVNKGIDAMIGIVWRVFLIWIMRANEVRICYGTDGY